MALIPRFAHAARLSQSLHLADFAGGGGFPSLICFAIISKGIRMQYIGLLIAAVIVGIDRFTKWLVTSNLGLKETISVIKFGDVEVLNISYYLNDGAAFSRFSGKSAMLIGVTSIMIVALVLMLLLKVIKKPSYIIAASLILGGGLGNLIDRVFNDGLVVDFIDVRIINFAIFNFADICAVCGTILVVFLLFTEDLWKKLAARRARANNNGGEDAAGNLPISEEQNGND